MTHVDYSARIQTVHARNQPALPRAARALQALTGCPVLVNTSFNVRGEPIVCTPEDAFRCFMGTEIEALAVGNCFLRKEDQDPALKPELRVEVRAGLNPSARASHCVVTRMMVEAAARP